MTRCTVRSDYFIAISIKFQQVTCHVLKVESISHHRKNEDTTPNFYTIKDDVVYTIVVKELIDGQWLPFEGKDMQMEFVRIDPFVRVTMENVGKGQLVANFKVPDTYGVYQFKVNYHRVGLTRLYSTNQVRMKTN